ncbi:hypothetical protein GOP96_05435 [Vibrio cholerae]|uniref:Uncharacterized protein n=1 Tax=Vibrio cholerae TaxID=666 RepID=A0A8B5ZMD6_VIBCL|nr:hypothetical protein [Vibrio paracholerae]MBW5431573.1 hypothetical protein [Vibrio cholerae]MBP8549291.1 hypothetical protein [Vibrio paracholerae]MCO7020523.1 hypothetical protein [Vibrio paracholerae]MCO7066107.1 hypothetical protein [Vibrio paracholerae]
MALTKGQPMAVQICSRQICHSFAACLQLGIKDKNKEAHAPLGYSSSSAIKASSRSLRNSLPFSVICQC